MENFLELVYNQMDRILYDRLHRYADVSPVTGRLLSLPVVLIDTLAMPPTLIASVVQELVLSMISVIKNDQRCKDHLQSALVSGFYTILCVPFSPVYFITTLFSALRHPEEARPGMIKLYDLFGF